MTQAPPTYPDLPRPPAFVPSAEAVEATARGISERLTMVEDWDSLPAVAKNHWCTIALEVLNDTGPLLVSSALKHVTDNHTAFGFDKALRDELVFAQLATAMPVTERADEDRNTVSQDPSDSDVG